MVLLAACDPFGSVVTEPTPIASTGGATVTPTTRGVASTLTTAPMPATQTAYPTAGTARAAVFAPLVLGSHQNIVYIFNQFGTYGSAQIKRYDTSTGKKVIIVNFPIQNLTGDTSHNGLWKMNLDGTGLTRLTTAGAGQMSSLNGTSQFTWSNIPRDANMYAMEISSNNDTTEALLIGSLGGTSPSTFATVSHTVGGVSIVGWTTI